MASNVYTKSEILQTLASKGYFIDAYTLDTFFKKWKVESIFEDEQGSEFYDKNVLDIIQNNLFNGKDNQNAMNSGTEVIRELSPRPAPMPQPQIPPQVLPQMPPQVPPQMPQYGYQQPYSMPPQMPQYGYQQQAPQMMPPKQEPVKKATPIDRQTADILDNISLSDGSSLLDKMKDVPSLDELGDIGDVKLKDDIFDDQPAAPKIKEQKVGILEGAMQLGGEEFPKDPNNDAMMLQNSANSDEFDDMSLLSESLEAQEKFKEYVISELQRKNADFNPNNLPQGNEFKLDISERTISMIARTMAKKIAKNINQIFTTEAKNLPELENLKEENKKLGQRTKELEEQNKKLRLLLSENKKYLSSFKPSIFGLYKKIDPDKEK